MAAEQDLGGQERPIGCAHDEDFFGGHKRGSLSFDEMEIAAGPVFTAAIEAMLGVAPEGCNRAAGRAGTRASAPRQLIRTAGSEKANGRLPLTGRRPHS
jgi:hypothetical protein